MHEVHQIWIHVYMYMNRGSTCCINCVYNILNNSTGPLIFYFNFDGRRDTPGGLSGLNCDASSDVCVSTAASFSDRPAPKDVSNLSLLWMIGERVVGADLSRLRKVVPSIQSQSFSAANCKVLLVSDITLYRLLLLNRWYISCSFLRASVGDGLINVGPFRARASRLGFVYHNDLW